jgi:hypothetical protein
MKAALGLNESRLVDLNKRQSAFTGTEANVFAQQVSNAAITLIRNNRHVLPIPDATIHAGEGRSPSRASRKLVVIIFADSRNSRVGPTFESQMRSRRPDAQISHYYNDHIASDAQPSEFIPAVKSADEVVLAAFITHAPGRQVPGRGKVVTAVGLSAEGAEFFGDIVTAARRRQS